MADPCVHVNQGIMSQAPSKGNKKPTSDLFVVTDTFLIMRIGKNMPGLSHEVEFTAAPK